MSNLIDLGHGLSLSFDRQGGETIRNVWLHFKAQSGKSASISIANFADRNNGIAGAAIRDWGSDRIGEHMVEAIAEEEAREEALANGQFGVGA